LEDSFILGDNVASLDKCILTYGSNILPSTLKVNMGLLTFKDDGSTFLRNVRIPLHRDTAS
jgi:hypothetical protein